MKISFLTLPATRCISQSALLKQSPASDEIISNELIGVIAKNQVLSAIMYPQQKGFTLVEIMIALLIGVFLLGGVMGVFLNTKQTYNVQEALSRLQENGRFAMDFLAKDIRMTDYRVCQTYTPPSLNNVGLNIPITGTEGVADATNRAKDLPDTITVKWSEESCSCLQPITPICVSTDVQKNRFYDITSGSLQVADQDLVEGVENMQIQYGVDSDMDISTGVPKGGDGTANYYVAGTAANFPDWQHWAQIVSVRVSLLLQTIEDNIASEQLPYTYNGGTFTPNDRRIRRVYTSTFALRNRIH
jgi:type IV pilus assembly protein PilW